MHNFIVIFVAYINHRNGFVQLARHLGKREGSDSIDDDVIFPYIDTCLIT